MIPHPPLVVPGVGKGEEIPNTRRAIEKIAAEIKQQNPETVVIISPHSVCYSDYFHIAPGIRTEGDFGRFGVKHIKFSVDYDQEFAQTISKIAAVKGLSAGFLGEREPALDHGVTVPLYFIKHKNIVRISVSGLSVLDHYRLGMCIAEAGKQLERNFVIIASGDMSHSLNSDAPGGFTKEGAEFDNLVRRCVESGDWQKLMQINPEFIENAAECGYRSLVMLVGAFEGQSIKSNVLNYEGPYGVGYLTASFESGGKIESLLQQLINNREQTIKQIRSQESDYVRLARQSVECFVCSGELLTVPTDLPQQLLTSRAGVFVSIKKDGNLRGCIGTTSPTESSLATEIIQNSVSACSRDTRFEPVEKEELPNLVYSVDVLFPPELIKNKSQLDVNRYGVIVRSGRRSGLLLPALSGVNTVDEQLGIALRKAGIGPDEPYQVERFEVVRHQ